MLCVDGMDQMDNKRMINQIIINNKNQNIHLRETTLSMDIK